MTDSQLLVQTDLLSEFLRSRNTGKPFSLQISRGPPHPPYRAIPDEPRIYHPEQVRSNSNMQGANLEFPADFYSHIAALAGEMGRILEESERGERG